MTGNGMVVWDGGMPMAVCADRLLRLLPVAARY